MDSQEENMPEKPNSVMVAAHTTLQEKGYAEEANLVVVAVHRTLKEKIAMEQ